MKIINKLLFINRNQVLFINNKEKIIFLYINK